PATAVPVSACSASQTRPETVACDRRHVRDPALQPISQTAHPGERRLRGLLPALAPATPGNSDRWRGLCATPACSRRTRSVLLPLHVCDSQFPSPPRCLPA